MGQEGSKFGYGVSTRLSTMESWNRRKNIWKISTKNKANSCLIGRLDSLQRLFDTITIDPLWIFYWFISIEKDMLSSSWRNFLNANPFEFPLVLSCPIHHHLCRRFAKRCCQIDIETSRRCLVNGRNTYRIPMIGKPFHACQIGRYWSKTAITSIYWNMNANARPQVWLKSAMIYITHA